ncbi:mevalonate kinase [Manduca sexta]|uniref:mevalonate kinase n=1 Tax=Manduca sexta TaxID=7130 RepID=UPI00188E9F5F|nr:mevalonate kinase [Manduca sexta]XP_037292644.1 mevalonate kinase [Manduca sexta]XP_037292645.1 mevalonate kinase [Manduca sexta]XP_037292646.1 mevalonate kinase [Manduca sexta]
MLNTMDLFTVSVSAPGKVILHGEHSVVYGKMAIAVSLGLRSSIVIKEINSNREPAVHIHLPCVDLQEVIPLEPTVKSLFNPKLAPGITGKFSWRLPDKIDHEYHLRRVDEFLHLIKPNFDSLQSNQKNSLRSFLYVFSGIFGSTHLPVRSMEISMGSELTIGAGTGSSASFAVCLAGALIQLLKLKSSSGSFDAYYHQSSEDFSMTEKEIISEWAYNCERIMHGTPSGIDNATCTFGSLVSFKKGSKPRHLSIRMELRVLLVDSRVSRETRALVVRVAALRQRNAPAVDHIMDACDDIAHTATQVLEKLSSGKCEPDIEADYQHLAELWDMNHCLLAALGVSHPSLETIRAAARAKGLACKLTGAGGGGYAMVLIPPSTPRSTIDSLTGQLLEHGFRVSETRLGGRGVSVEM